MLILNYLRQARIFNPYERALIPVINGLKAEEKALGILSPFLDKEAFISASSSLKSNSEAVKIESPTLLQAPNFTLFIPNKWKSFLRVISVKNNTILQEENHKGEIFHSVDLVSNPGDYNLVLPEETTAAQFSYNDKIPLKDILEGFFEFSYDGELKQTPFTFRGNSNEANINVGKMPVSAIVYARAKNGYHWISFENHLFLFDHNREFLKDLSPLLKQKTTAKWTPNRLFIDANQRVWLATGAGVFVISAKRNPFTQYLKEDGNFPIRGIIELPESKLLVGTNNLNRIIDLSTGNEEILPLKGVLLGITKGPNGNYYAGSHGRSIFQIAPELSYYTSTDLKDLPGINLTVPYYDSLSNTCFIGSSYGLYTAANFESPIQEYRPISAPNSFEDKPVNHFHRSANGLWISGGDGLYLLNKEQILLLKFQVKGDVIKHFHQDRNGVFWVATSGSGLFRWDPNSNKSKQYTINEGLTNNVIYAVYEDESGLLWLPSNKGLMQFNPKTEFIRDFQPSDGITHEEFNTFSHFQAEDGRLYFGGMNGITAFYPKDIFLQQANTPMRLTGHQQYNSKKNIVEDKLKDYQQTKKITLTPGDKFFNVKFALQDYSANEITYAWKLLPDDKVWTYQNENTLRINGLAAGKHQLIIKANRLETAQDNNQLVLDILVLRPFYQRWPFLTILTLSLSLLIWAYIKYRTWKIEKEKHQLAELVEKRTSELARKNEELTKSNATKNRLFTLISHDLRAPVISLRGITKKVQFLVAQKRYGEINALSETVDRAVGSTQNLLDNLLSWAMYQGDETPYTPESFDLSQCLRENMELFETIANNKGVTLINEQKGSLPVFADPTGIATIVRNLTDNAIKFTPSGRTVTIKSFTHSTHTIIQIKDEGIGITPEKAQRLFTPGEHQSTVGTDGEKGTGLGLQLCTEIARMNRAKLSLLSTSQSGTTIQLTIPAQALLDSV